MTRFFLNDLEYPGVSQNEFICFWGHGHVRKSEHHENEGFGDFPKMNPKSY